MRKLNIVLSIIIIFTITVFSLTIVPNLVFRTSSVYSFYFNDTRVVEKLYTSRTADEMADEISGYINSFSDVPFRVYEDTGYDLENIFTDDEGFNMQVMKRVLDKLLYLSLACLLFSIIVYAHFLRENKKKVLRDRYYISLVLTIAGTIFEFATIMSTTGQAKMISLLGLIELPPNNYLSILVGEAFLGTAIKFLLVASIIVIAVSTYIVMKLTKPDRIFF